MSQIIEVRSEGQNVVSASGLRTFSVKTHLHRLTFLKVTGIRLANPYPKAVLVTVRAPDNDNPPYADSFAVTVNQTAADYVILKVWRTDAEYEPSAPFQLDVLVVD